MKIIKLLSTLAVPALLMVGCTKDMDIENLNDPDFKKVYASGEDLQNLASSLYNTVYQGSHSYDGVEMMLSTAADHVSCSWGNAAMRDMSWEPRNMAWNNSPAYSNGGTTYAYFNNMYAAINTASNVLKALDGGVKVGNGASDQDRVKAMCKFIQGVAYGNLALVFDKGFVVDETKTIDNARVTDANSYEEIAAAAVKYLDEAITLSNGFTIPAAWLGTEADLTDADFKMLASTYAARILSYTPRSTADMAKVDWARVKTYADAGITADFNVVNDGYTKWYAEAGDYLTYNGWGVTDMYVVHLMDPTQPQHWEDDASFPYPAESTNPIDERLNTDFNYVPSNWFQAARGYYHFSNYRSKRYDAFYVNAEGPKPEVMKAENDMLRAEARAYTGDLSGAADIINASTRSTRGKMEDVTPNLEDIIKAIHHERHVEMYTTGMGLQFFEMRKLDLLQKGTPLHLPLPAKTLETFGEKTFYTFGGTANADGINVSNKGWR